MKSELEFFTKFKIYTQQRSLPTTQFTLHSRFKKAFWYMALHNETILRERTITSTKHRAKNILTNETANFESALKTGYLSDMSDPLTFHVNGNQHTATLKM